MGDFFRRYWLPALLSEEIPEPDCPPVQVRLLGEELVAFRDSQGRIGLLEEHCLHRGTSLYYGRNEACGLRCIYHGWKYDVRGRVLDTPAEPGQSSFKDRLQHLGCLHQQFTPDGYTALYAQDTAPAYEVEETDFGLRLIALRQTNDGRTYVRVSSFVMPVSCWVPARGKENHIYVPADDTHAWRYDLGWKLDRPIRPEDVHRRGEMWPGDPPLPAPA